ncbi:hypothetical protein EG68_10529 [Paragonimus skrjabini miyazakii]|uniref:Uncharacterized protein n=1 Tax=Paragonimus skrjabini miyazakii TaxID=59628 RepID=A0A8S9YB38_9TREM|nr:hypothetical protein EG68_10529 [Paragonimus skrjabini miyazakii]
MDYDVTETMHNIRLLAGSSLETHIPAYCERNVFPKTMYNLRQPLQTLQGSKLLEKLGEVWRKFFTVTVPTISLIFSILPTTQNVFESMLLRLFLRDIVQKVNFWESLAAAKHLDPRVKHMCYLILTFCQKDVQRGDLLRYNAILVDHITRSNHRQSK